MASEIETVAAYQCKHCGSLNIDFMMTGSYGTETPFCSVCDRTEVRQLELTLDVNWETGYVVELSRSITSEDPHMSSVFSRLD